MDNLLPFHREIFSGRISHGRTRWKRLQRDIQNPPGAFLSVFSRSFFSSSPPKVTAQLKSAGKARKQITDKFISP
jgi:hypothetical protein